MARGRKAGTKVNPKNGKVVSPSQVKTEEVKEDVSIELNPSEIPQDDYVVEKKMVEPTEKPFERKDRYYYLVGDKKPVVHFLKSKRIIWFDEEKGHEREIQFTENQKTPFVDEFVGEVRPATMAFREGALFVPANKVVWQKILSIYHEDLGKIYLERDDEKDAIDELEIIELEFQAMEMSRAMDITKAESIVRVKDGSAVSKMSEKEIRRSLMLYCRENPQLVIDLAEDDNVEARNLGIKAVEQRILFLSSDRRTFFWASNQRKLFNVPFEEHPYAALVKWFKTDEGLDVYAQLEKLVV